MTKFSVLKTISLASFVLGVVFLFNAFSGFTGYSVIGEAGVAARSIYGLSFILIGIFTFLADR